MNHSPKTNSGTAKSGIKSSLALNLVNQRNELLWLAYLLTGDRSASVDTVADAVDLNDVGNPFFKNWMVSWARKLVIVKARSRVDAALAASARRTRKRQSTDAADQLQPIDWRVGDSDRAELERALLAIDLLPRWALLLTVFEKVSSDEAARLLGVERDLFWFARTTGLMELTGNIAREQGWIPAVASAPARRAMAAG
jgi:hypothetical protein